MPLLTVALVPDAAHVVLRLTGEADLSTLPALTDALTAAAGTGAPHVVVDVTDARFWDSSSLRALADATAALATSGRTCRVAGADAATRRLVQIAGYDDLLVLDGSGTQNAVHDDRGTVVVDGVRRAA